MILNFNKKIVLILLTEAIAGITFGVSMPLGSLTLETWGVSSSMIGLSSAMPALAAVIVTPFLPRLINYFDQLSILKFAFVLVPLSLVSLAFTENLFIWFFLRFSLGVGGTIIWVITEIWINSYARDDNRGIIIAIYTSVLSLGFITGVLLLSMISVENYNTAFYMAATIAILAAVPIWPIRDWPKHDVVEDISFFKYFKKTPSLMGSSWVMGFLYAGTASLLPIFALQNELNYSESSRTVAWLGSGELLLPILVGFMADRMSKRRLMIIITMITTLGMFIMPYIFSYPLPRVMLLFILGGAIMSLYSLGLTMLGHQFKGQALTSANASFIFFLCLGEICGPIVIGTSMDIFGSYSFGWVSALFCFVYLLIFISTGSMKEVK
ncbi:MAG: MFS transporter [Gammaproteobacteria bacterium]|nr:MFS transporter [Gammaproteobacteria bacterium]